MVATCLHKTTNWREPIKAKLQTRSPMLHSRWQIHIQFERPSHNIWALSRSSPVCVSVNITPREKSWTSMLVSSRTPCKTHKQIKLHPRELQEDQKQVWSPIRFGKSDQHWWKKTQISRYGRRVNIGAHLNPAQSSSPATNPTFNLDRLW